MNSQAIQPREFATTQRSLKRQLDRGMAVGDEFLAKGERMRVVSIGEPYLLDGVWMQNIYAVPAGEFDAYMATHRQEL